MDSLSLFHPLVAEWFRDAVGRPTDVQRKSLQLIAEGRHLLVTAPTGGGKTFTGFLSALNSLISGDWPTGCTSVLYVSPLKALNTDIRRNLLTPLAELKTRFHDNGLDVPNIRVMTRSGDTPQSERRSMVRKPPEILITTPESLNLLLSSKSRLSILGDLKLVILDEIHAVLGEKRGTYLITAVDRLVPLSGEFQRIGLSATVKPEQTAAAFLGGYTLHGSGPEPEYRPRPVEIIRSDMEKHIELQVRSCDFSDTVLGADRVWNPIVEEIKDHIASARSTLIFVNNRRLCEKMVLKINTDAPAPVAYAHHGSLSKELRTAVEKRFKEGDLKAVTATNSLELGIDIGNLDKVLLVQTPISIAAALQRLGRAGHRVGEVSRGFLYPTHDQDLLLAAALAQPVLSRDIEPVEPIIAPLDVLTQILVSMAGTTVQDIDDVYNRLRTSYPYHNLGRKLFDAVLRMAAGRYEETRIRELKPLLSVDRLDNTISAAPGALMSLYLSGGVIPDRGMYRLRRADSGARIGELDEEFVWEAAIGQTFTLGTHDWRIDRITHSDVLVLPAKPRAGTPPFWRGEEPRRSYHFSRRLGEFLEHAEKLLQGRNEKELRRTLMQEHALNDIGADRLIEFLKLQREITKRPLPHRHHLLLEYTVSGPGGVPGNRILLHTLWGLRVNRPFAAALKAAWAERFGTDCEIFTDNDCIVLILPQNLEPEEILAMVPPDRLKELVQKGLPASGLFGAAFREAAGRALVLTRRNFSKRMPLWMNRLRAQKLMSAIKRYEDFPLLLEAYRTCLKDVFDLPALEALLSELESGEIRWSQARTGRSSPMTRGLEWRNITEYMYAPDSSPADALQSTRPDLLREAVFGPELRPELEPDLVREFEMKRRRTAPGYSPKPGRDLLDWIKERQVLPQPEWNELLQAVERDHSVPPEEAEELIAGKATYLAPPGAAQPLFVALENRERVQTAFYADAAAQDEQAEAAAGLLSEILSFYGPISREHIARMLGIDDTRTEFLLDDLLETKRVIQGPLLAGDSEKYVCDAENFEILLRMARARRRPAFETLPLEMLQPFLARRQGVRQQAQDADEFFRVLEKLLYMPLPAAHWESFVFPSRMRNYRPEVLDTLLHEGEIRWLGRESMHTAFYYADDPDLFHKNDSSESSEPGELFPDVRGRYDFSVLLHTTGMTPSRLTTELWQRVEQGTAAADTFAPVRRGLKTGFKLPKTQQAATTTRKRSGRVGAARKLRGAYAEKLAAVPWSGGWFFPEQPRPAEDPLEEEERNKDRVRLLLERYGVLFRELLWREQSPFTWGELFRSIRLMELSGELVSGQFFSHIPGPQFTSAEGLRALQRDMDDAFYFLCAADPASLSGLPLEARRGVLPARAESTFQGFFGAELVFIAKRKGKELIFALPPDHPRLTETLQPLHMLMSRSFKPLRSIAVKSINQTPAKDSEYLDVLKAAFEVVVDPKGVVLYPRR